MSRFSQSTFLISAAAPAQFPPDVGAEVAFVGRSNAGKSSAINAITQRHGLARTSKIPGRTRLLNFFELYPGARLVDLPGYGYADVPAAQRRTWPPLIEALRERVSLRGLFVIVDARRGLKPSGCGSPGLGLPGATRARAAVQGRQAQQGRGGWRAQVGAGATRRARHRAALLGAQGNRGQGGCRTRSRAGCATEAPPRPK